MRLRNVLRIRDNLVLKVVSFFISRRIIIYIDPSLTLSESVFQALHDQDIETVEPSNQLFPLILCF
jgi:hypothetical protein